MRLIKQYNFSRLCSQLNNYYRSNLYSRWAHRCLGIIRQIFNSRMLYCYIPRSSDMRKRLKPIQLFRHMVACIIIGFGLEYNEYDLVQLARFVCIFGLHILPNTKSALYRHVAVIKLRLTLCHVSWKCAEL